MYTTTCNFKRQAGIYFGYEYKKIIQVIEKYKIFDNINIGGMKYENHFFGR